MAQGGAKTICQLRQERGWTPEQVARQVRVAEITVERWERGEQRPQLRYRRRMAALFGVNAEAIAFGPATRGRYVVILEGPGLRLVTEHASRAAAMVALKQEIAHLEAGGATILGTLPHGYAARWTAYGQPVTVHLTLVRTEHPSASR